MAFRLNPLFPRRGGIAPLAAIGFVLAVLVIFNGSNWRMMRLLENSKEDDLARRVRSVTRVAAHELTYPAPPSILDAISRAEADAEAEALDSFPDTDEYEALSQRLARIKGESGLAQVLLLTPRGSVVADSNYRFLTGEPLPFSIDQQFFERAREGHGAATPLYDWEGEHFQRDYEPVVDDSGTTIGVLMGSISADYLESLRHVHSQVIRLSLLSSVILLLLGFYLYQMFRYVARLERDALQRVRVKAMGALAAGMAHELRNPLAIIRALAEEIQADQIADSQTADSRTAENSADIIQETQRLSELASNFLSFSRPPDSANLQQVNLSAEISRVVQLMQKSASPNLNISFQKTQVPVYVNADPRALRQLFLNLLLNAREAVDANTGAINISFRERRNLVEVRVQDNGPGIPARTLSRVFEPFYTTHQNGTGLGLSISRGIAENLGGTLTLESSRAGTVAIVALPLWKMAMEK